MRSVVLMMSVSVDGYVAGPCGHGGALPEPGELSRWKLDRIRGAGTHIMGRTTYEEMAGYWPASTDDYAAPMNEIATLRRQPGGEIIAWGGANFAGRSGAPCLT